MRARDYYFLVNTTLEPRRVDKPFLRRWLRMSFGLFVRSPLRFCLVIALLGWLDASAVNLAEGYAVQKIWVDRLGMLILPVLWILISAVARANESG
jgi:hypothetical protein